VSAFLMNKVHARQCMCLGTFFFWLLWGHCWWPVFQIMAITQQGHLWKWGFIKPHSRGTSWAKVPLQHDSKQSTNTAFFFFHSFILPTKYYQVPDMLGTMPGVCT
jgi:hypothetical protein